MLLGLLVLPFFAACTGGECPCGRSFESSPFDPYGAPIGTDHPRGIHCICRCGVGDEVLEDPAIDCAIYEGECLGPGGERAEYRCR
jgi:hypothetical protein